MCLDFKMYRKSLMHAFSHTIFSPCAFIVIVGVIICPLVVEVVIAVDLVVTSTIIIKSQI